MQPVPLAMHHRRRTDELKAWTKVIGLSRRYRRRGLTVRPSKRHQWCDPAQASKCHFGWLEFDEERSELGTPDLAPQDRMLLRVDSVDREDMLGGIDRDTFKVPRGRAFSWFVHRPNGGTFDAVGFGPSTPIMGSAKDHNNRTACGGRCASGVPRSSVSP
jgi:hypothetical protein